MLRSACLTLAEVVYHKTPNLYTKNFRRCLTPRLFAWKSFEKLLRDVSCFAIIGKIIGYYGRYIGL